MGPLIDKVNEQCLADYLPEQSVSIDESMVPYFGRHGCKQYMRNKPVKFGYKFWVAATPLKYATHSEGKRHCCDWNCQV